MDGEGSYGFTNNSYMRDGEFGRMDGCRHEELKVRGPQHNVHEERQKKSVSLDLQYYV
jgi:hypothetical protein